MIKKNEAGRGKLTTQSQQAGAIGSDGFQVAEASPGYVALPPQPKVLFPMIDCHTFFETLDYTAKYAAYPPPPPGFRYLLFKTRYPRKNDGVLKMISRRDKGDSISDVSLHRG